MLISPSLTFEKIPNSWNMCVDLREMSDQKLTQIRPFDPKISAKKDAFEKVRKS